MQERPFSKKNAQGFTLVELLLATAIAVIVVALAWSLLSSTTRAVGRQAERARGPQAATRALEVMRADLTGLFFPTNDEACKLELRPAGDDSFYFALCTIRATNRTPDLLWTEPVRVEYAIAQVGENTNAFVRISQTLSGPILVETNVLLDHVASVQVELGDGDTWETTWPPPGDDAIPICAARVSILAADSEGAQPLSADYWLPAGQVMTSRLVRAGSVEE